jgi:hypothetical protein
MSYVNIIRANKGRKAMLSLGFINILKGITRQNELKMM